MIADILVKFLKLSEPFEWVSRLIILVVFFNNLRLFKLNVLIDRKGYILISFFLCLLFLGFLRATLIAEGYWIWKSVANQFLISSFYIVIFLSSNIHVVQYYYRLYFVLFIPLVLISYLIDQTPLNLDYVPYSTLLIFLGLIPKKQRIILISIVFFFFLTIFQRNDLVKILASASIGIIFTFFSNGLIKFILKPAHAFLLGLPLLLLLLASTGVFNIFKMDEYVKGDLDQKISTSEGIVNDNLKADTRTFIYENVFYTMKKYDSWLLGRSPALGDEGVVGGFAGKDEKTKVKGRYGNEVGIMDILLWYGLIGAVLYFLIYLRATYVAIYLSRNKYAKALGLYVSFLWTWSFIWEKPMFETFFMMDLILLGLCFSNRFRLMTDHEVKLWVKGIFIYNPKKRLA